MGGYKTTQIGAEFWLARQLQRRSRRAAVFFLVLFLLSISPLFIRSSRFGQFNAKQSSNTELQPSSVTCMAHFFNFLINKSQLRHRSRWGLPRRRLPRRRGRSGGRRNMRRFIRSRYKCGKFTYSGVSKTGQSSCWNGKNCLVDKFLVF